MADLENLENKVAGKGSRRNSVGKFTVALLALGVGMIAFGVYLSTNGVSITADVEPPRPSDPSRVSPPVPEVPTRGGQNVPPLPTGPGEYAFRSGWSMISGEELYGYDLTNFRNAGLALYSFNDPKYANRDWAVIFGDSTECQQEQIGCDVIVPQAPLGYYVYNASGSEARVTLQPVTSTVDLSNNIFGRGWHTLYWNGDAIGKDGLLEKIVFTYSDGRSLTAKQAMTDAEHKVSLEIYGVVDENTIDISKALKKLGSGADELNTIPKGGYFWVYLRRTAKRVTAISVDDAYVSQAEDERALIDAWISANNLTECGDPSGTVYTGGSCLFNESTGQYQDKYELIVNKFPDKPWRN